MAPGDRTKVISVTDTDKSTFDDELYKMGESLGTDYNFKGEVVYRNVILFAILHVAGFYGWLLCLFQCKWSTALFGWALGNISSFGVTGGAHRLYAHRTYKANLPLRFCLVLLFTITGQNSLYRWVLEHRQHHKYTDTDADPHNSNRGFFFSHIGWLMSRPHPAVQQKRRTIDMTDLDADALVMFQRKYFAQLFFIFGFLLPVAIPVYFFNESLWNAFFVAFAWRYTTTLNFTWTVNSVAHMWGARPYDKDIKPRESYLAAYLANGEGWHNYHHSFPWDYKTSEHGVSFIFNPTTHVIDLLSQFGWAYDLKTTSDGMIKKKITRTGDGTHPKTMKIQEITH